MIVDSRNRALVGLSADGSTFHIPSRITRRILVPSFASARAKYSDLRFLTRVRAQLDTFVSDPTPIAERILAEARFELPGPVG